jgi:hypothetical protein
MKRMLLAVLLVIMVMASCADPPAPASGKPAESEPASITVSATYDESSCCYIEGFIPVVRIVGSGVQAENEFKEFELSGAGVGEVVLEVPRGGEYTLKSWVEPCAAICATDVPRDPPTDHCSASVTVPDGDDLAVDLSIRNFEHCQLSVEGQ